MKAKNLKISDADYNNLENAIMEVLKENGYTLVSFKHACFVNGSSHARMRWNLFYAANVRTKGQPFKHLSAYLDNSHIDSALRSITKTRK